MQPIATPVTRLVFVFLILGLGGCSDEKREEGREQLQQQAAQQVQAAEQKMNEYDFDAAKKLLYALREDIRRSSYLDVATEDKIIADIDAVHDAISDKQSDFFRKKGQGWSIVDGRLVSPQDKAGALAEQKRKEQAERARREVDKAKLAAEAKAHRDKAERAEREAERIRIASDPEALRQRHSEAMAALRRQFPYVPISDWKGQKIQFLERSAGVQRFGYQDFKGGQGEFGHPTYGEAVGRIGTVVDVAYDGLVLYTISLRMDDNGQVYKATIADFLSVHSMAPLADIEKARALWKGKTLWTSRRELVTYDPQTEKFGTVENSRYARVKVIDVVAGWYNRGPVRFILDLASGERGFLDCQLSGTNVSDILRRPWEFAECFFLEDPQGLFPWNERTWSAIQKGSVFIGMTPEQARLSWGAPQEVNRTTTAQEQREQWVYGLGTYLYFVNGRLDAIQN